MKLKLFTLILTALLLSSCSSGVTADRFFTLDFYETEVIPSTTYLAVGEVAAVEFYAAEDFSGIEILAAKVSEEDTLTVTVYHFNTDYETTLKSGKVIEKATFRGYDNRDTLMMSFKTAPKGKYLLTFSTKSSAGICLAAYPSEYAKGEVEFYLNGSEYKDGAFYAGVIFNGDRLNKNYFKNDIPEPPESTPEDPIAPETPVDPEDLPAEGDVPETGEEE